MATIDVEAEVVADLKALDSIAPAKVYFVDDAPMDDDLPVQGGLAVPHVVVYPGRPQTSSAGRGIIGTALDPVRNYVFVEVVAPNYTIAKQLGTAINERMMGRKYGDVSSEMILDSTSGGRNVKKERVPPVVYVYALAYRYITNLG